MTDTQAAQTLLDAWRIGNNGEKATWQAQKDADEASTAEQQWRYEELEDKEAATSQLEEEAMQKEEQKKNKDKYLPFPDRPPPIQTRNILTAFALQKLIKGHYLPIWYFTNDGFNSAQRHTNNTDTQAMIMMHEPDGTTSWQKAALAHQGVHEDEDLTFKEFCNAVPLFIKAMEENRWPRQQVKMFTTLWCNIQTHEMRRSRDPLDQKALLVYTTEQQWAWHQAILTPQSAYNIKIINEIILTKISDWLYREDRIVQNQDYRRFTRISPSN